ncbi:Reverse transcriptase domain-containing protein, partial [Aphis craccivora]
HNYIVKALDQNFEVNAIYTDFQKTFDKVNHNLLYCKLKNHGGYFLKRLFSYLFGRRQVIKMMSNVFADEYPVYYQAFLRETILVLYNIVYII